MVTEKNDQKSVKHFENDSLIELFEDVLSDNEGVFIGEVHGNVNHLIYLTEHMQELRNLGVRQIYSEVFSVEEQLFIDAYYDDVEWAEQDLFNLIYHNFEMKFELGYLFYGIGEYSFLMIVAAKAAGIEVIGVNREYPSDIDLDLEFELSNPLWSDVINDNKMRLQDGERYLIIGGKSHGYDRNNRPTQENIDGKINAIKKETLPGIDEILGVPSIDFEPSYDVDGFAIEQSNDQFADYIVYTEAGYPFENATVDWVDKYVPESEQIERFKVLLEKHDVQLSDYPRKRDLWDAMRDNFGIQGIDGQRMDHLTTAMLEKTLKQLWREEVPLFNNFLFMQGRQESRAAKQEENNDTTFNPGLEHQR